MVDVILVVAVTAETLTSVTGTVTEMTAGEVVVVWTDEECFMSLKSQSFYLFGGRIDTLQSSLNKILKLKINWKDI